MPEFSWRARTVQGAPVSGVLHATGTLELSHALAEQGLTLTTCASKKPKRAAVRPAKTISQTERILITQQISDSLAAGISLVETLSEIARAYPKPRIRRMFEIIVTHVEGGGTLSEGLAQFNRAFPSTFTEVVRAGEATGQLAQVFELLGEELEWREEMSGQVIGALVYPAILVFATLGVSCLFLFVLLPQFEPLFNASGAELPTITLLLLAVSKVVRENWLLMLVALPIVVGTLRMALRSEKGQRVSDSLLLSLPGLGGINRHLLIARFTRSLGTLLEAGVSLPAAMSLGGGSAGNHTFNRAITKARSDVLSGKGLAESLGATEHLGSLDVRMIAVGERAGRLTHAFASLAKLHSKNARRKIETMVRVLEPLLIMLMAAVVVALGMAVLLPIYQSLDKIG